MTTVEQAPLPSPSSTSPSRPSPIRPHVVGSVFSRDLLGYFSNPAGYVFITLFVVTSSAAAFWQDAFFANNLATLDTLNQYMPYLLLLFIPAITMSIWAEDRRLGTDEVLLTLPAYDYEVVLGKFLAASGIYTVALAFSITHVVVLSILGQPDYGVLVATYLGYWLMGMLLVSIGMVSSILSTNVTVAFILGALFAAVPVFLGSAGTLLGPSASDGPLAMLSIPSQFEPFGEGLVTLNGVAYFVLGTIGFLALNMVLLGRRHWAGSPRSGLNWSNYSVRFVAGAVILASLTVLAGRLGARVDVTAERLHTLSPVTAQLIKELPEERPVYVQAFVSPDQDLPPEYLETKKDLVNLLRQFSSQAGDRIRLNLIETTPTSERAQEAQDRFGIEPQSVIFQAAGKQQENEIFLGAAFVSGLEEVVIPLFAPGVPVEYEITRSIQVVSRTERRTIGVLQTDAELMGGAGFMGGPTSVQWRLVDELEKQYEVQSVTADAEIDGQEIDVLLAVSPSSLTQPQMDNLKVFIDAGGPTLMMVDPLPYFDPSVSPSVPRQPAGGPFGGGAQPEPKGNLSTVLSGLNVSFPTDQIVASSYFPYPQLDNLRNTPEIVFVGTNNGAVEPFNSSELASAGLQEMVLLFPGYIRTELGSALEVTPLISTGPNGALVNYNELLTRDPFGRQTINSRPIRRPVSRELNLAVRISRPDSDEDEIEAEDESPRQEGASDAQETGSDEETAESGDASTPIDVILISDADLASDQFFALRESAQELRFDNVEFVLNCIDVLAGDEAFIPLRSRRPAHRTLEKLEEQTGELIETVTEVREQARQEAEEKLAEAQEKLDAKLAEIQRGEGDALDILDTTLLTAESEQRKFQVDQAAIRRSEQSRIREAELKADREIQEIQNGVRVAALILPPLPPLVLGLAVFASRFNRENRGANLKRLA